MGDGLSFFFKAGSEKSAAFLELEGMVLVQMAKQSKWKK
jgi:hypothetical protein